MPAAQLRVRVKGKALTRLEGERDDRGRRQRVKYAPGAELTVSPRLYEAAKDRLMPIGGARTAAAPAGGDELDVLRAEAEAAGVKVDPRWKANRLRKEIEAAKATSGAPPAGGNEPSREQLLAEAVELEIEVGEDWTAEQLQAEIDKASAGDE